MVGWGRQASKAGPVSPRPCLSCLSNAHHACRHTRSLGQCLSVCPVRHQEGSFLSVWPQARFTMSCPGRQSFHACWEGPVCCLPSCLSGMGNWEGRQVGVGTWHACCFGECSGRRATQTWRTAACLPSRLCPSNFRLPVFLSLILRSF